MTTQPLFPLAEFLGMTVESREGSTVATLELDARHHNPNGVAHGAVAFALMDTAMGGAVMGVVPEGSACATVEFHTRFYRGPGDGSLTAEATVINAGRRIVHLEATTIDDDGRLVASATASFAVIQPRT
jgi:acyl-CoA thioesterase